MEWMLRQPVALASVVISDVWSCLSEPKWKSLMRVVLNDLPLALFAPAINVSELKITAGGFHLSQGTILMDPFDSVKNLTHAIELFDKYEFQK
jgi:hypothetical protein